jgi:SAF domain.
MNAILLVNENDNVVTCLKPLTAGEVLELETGLLTVKEDVPSYHKLALFAISKGDLCFTNGQVIGRAARDLEPGEPVNHHDLEKAHGGGERSEKTGRLSSE